MNKVQIALAFGCLVFGLVACGKGGGSGRKADGTGGAGTNTNAGGGLAGSIGSGSAGLGGADTGGTTGQGGATVLGGTTSAGGATGAGGVLRTGGSGASGGTAGSGGRPASGSTTWAGGMMGGNTGGASGGTPTTGGSINTGGASASGSTLPNCNRDAGLTYAEGCGYLVAPGNMVLDTNVTAEVTVKAVLDPVKSSPCGYERETRRVSLAAADGNTWDLDLNVTGLPADFIRQGDALGLTVASWRNGRSVGPPPVSQSVVVTRDGKTILITWSGTASAISWRSPEKGGAPAPVTIAGVSLADDGFTCAYPASLCDSWYHRARITVGSSSAAVEPGQSVNVGGLQVVLDEYFDAVDRGYCDGFGRLMFAAFVP